MLMLTPDHAHCFCDGYQMSICCFFHYCSTIRNNFFFLFIYLCMSLFTKKFSQKISELWSVVYFDAKIVIFPGPFILAPSLSHALSYSVKTFQDLPYTSPAPALELATY